MVFGILPLIVVGLFHVVLALAAIRFVSSRGVYSSGQLAVQSALALLVPLFGPLVVFLATREAVAPIDKPDESRFDRDTWGPHG